MSTFPVSAQKEKELIERMEKLGVRAEDLVETFIRSSGAGGQKVNKSSTCVSLHHLPTGIKVKCQTERSQGLNRFLARRVLLDRIEHLREGILRAEKEQISKIRRQKKRRSRKTRARLREDKRLQAEKKRQRSPINIDRHEEA